MVQILMQVCLCELVQLALNLLSLLFTSGQFMRPSPWGTCSPKINRFAPMFPKIKILISYVPCSPKLPLFYGSPHFWTFFPLFPWNKYAPSHPYPPQIKRTWEGLISWPSTLCVGGWEVKSYYSWELYFCSYKFVFANSVPRKFNIMWNICLYIIAIQW